MSSDTTMAAAGEDGLLAALRPLLQRHTEGLPLPSGDDASITAPGEPRRMVWTIDSMIEGTHFRWWPHPEATAEALGEKLAASNLSDLASKGARPLHALLSLGVPGEVSMQSVSAFMEGLASALEAHGARLVGGDTVRAPCWMLTLSLAGELDPEATIAARSKACPGHGVYITGCPGEGAAGLWLLESGGATSGPMTHLVRRHLRPTPRLAIGREAAARFPDLAMIDLSDGLARDAARVAELSGVRLVLERGRLPLTEPLREAAQRAGRDPLDWILHGGEDYELLFTTAAPAEEVCALSPLIRRVGRVESGSGLVLATEGTLEPLPSRGFEHYHPTDHPPRTDNQQ